MGPLTSQAFSHIVFQDLLDTKLENDEKNELEKELEEPEQDSGEETGLHSSGDEQRQI